MIHRRILPLGAGIALLSVLASHAAAANEVLPFEHADMKVVYSASDDDAEILIRATGVDPIGQVRIVGPGGTVRLKATFRDGDRLGQADVHFDTPEPSLKDLMQAYPEGEYRFRGRTAAGEKLAGVAELSYEPLAGPHDPISAGWGDRRADQGPGSAVVRARRAGTDPAPGGG